MQAFPFTSKIEYDMDGNIQYDRAVDSIILRNLIRQYVTNGVFPNPSTNFQVVASGNDDMTVMVQPGACVINGTTAYEIDTRELIVQAADSLDRIDTVVLRLNDHLDVRSIDLYVVKGTPASTPVQPTLTRIQDVYELGIANLYIKANTTRIPQERITDTRLSEDRCGYAGFMTEIDTQAFYDQIQADLQRFKNTEQTNFSAWENQFQIDANAWLSQFETGLQTWESTQHETVQDYIDEISQMIADNTEVIIIRRLDALEDRMDSAEDNISNLEQNLDTHRTEVISSETGVHGTRYFNGKLQVKNPTTGIWEDTASGGSGIAPSNVSDIVCVSGNGSIRLQWTDPGDTIIDGKVLSTWKGTKVVMKAGAYPENENDGNIVVDNQVLNQYATGDGFTVNGLTNGVTYYFQFFPYSDSGAVNRNALNRCFRTPKEYKIYTVIIDQSNSNPSTCCTYADDADTMTAGSSDWDDFFGQTPVLLDLVGNELGNLKVSDYSKFEDGTSAPITTVGNDVMVKFPKRGLKISTSGDTVSISMTDNPNAESDGFKYYAHSYGANNNCDEIYVGAYKGYVESNKLYSSSGKAPKVNQTIGTFRTQANARGTGYEQMTFYVRTFLIAAYILKYKHLNSQTVVGRGYVEINAAASNTGKTNEKGMDWGETTGQYQCKCLGVEDLWGNINEWIDGIFSNSTGNILTKTTNNSMNDTGSGYMDQVQSTILDTYGYIDKVQGTTGKGFVPESFSGSSSTYFCDEGSLRTSKVAHGGDRYRRSFYAGVFSLFFSKLASDLDETIGARLIKFKVAS